MSGKEHMRKHEDIKYNRKEIVKLLLDIPWGCIKTWWRREGKIYLRD
jgi:hypothetical protein